jgi:hypothetical protein
MKTDQLVRLYGSKTAIAEALTISKQAISEWGDDVPLLRQYQLRERRPTIDQELQLAGQGQVNA